MSIRIIKYINLSFLVFALLILSCSDKKYKEYDKVNILKSEDSSQKETQNIIFPSGFKSTQQLIIETSFSKVNVSAWPLDSIVVNHSNYDPEIMQVELYEGQNQLIYREKSNTKFKGELNIKVPENVNLNIKNQYGHLIIEGIKGTFDVNSIAGNILIENCESAMKILCQSGKIHAINWAQRGRTKMTSASGSVIIQSKDNINYALNIHSGSDTVGVYLNGNTLRCNVEALKFQDKGKIESDFDFGQSQQFYSDALEIYYDQYKMNIIDNAPLLSISTGDGIIILNK